MSLLNALTGNVSQISPTEVQKEVGDLLLPGEEIQVAARAVRDLVILTDRRVLMVDKQGMSGKKTEYLTIPFVSVTRFSIETAGRFDLDADLKLWVSSESEPIRIDMGRGTDVLGIQKILAAAIMAK